VNPLTAGIDLRFLNPRRICAVCGREVDADGATPVAELDPAVESAAEGLNLLVDVTPGEALVVCSGCQPG